MHFDNQAPNYEVAPQMGDYEVAPQMGDAPLMENALPIVEDPNYTPIMIRLCNKFCAIVDYWYTYGAIYKLPIFLTFYSLYIRHIQITKPDLHKIARRDLAQWLKWVPQQFPPECLIIIVVLAILDVCTYLHWTFEPRYSQSKKARLYWDVQAAIKTNRQIAKNQCKAIKEQSEILKEAKNTNAYLTKMTQVLTTKLEHIYNRLLKLEESVPRINEAFEVGQHIARANAVNPNSVIILGRNESKPR